MTTAELEVAGFSEARIRRLVRQGVLLRVGRGVYARVALVGETTRDPVRRRDYRRTARYRAR